MVQRVYDICRRLWSRVLTIYGYGIDLAQSLNYCGIIVTKIEDKIRLVTLRKFQNIKYPEITRILFNDLFKRFPPTYICIDYTNERSFSETLEEKLNPQFTIPNSFTQWKIVDPVVFTQSQKLAMKQNARELLEKKYFVWPKRSSSDPRIWSLVEELREQMLREAGTPGMNGLLKFPKPEGHDNDLVIALELNLRGAKKYLPEFAFKVIAVKLKTGFNGEGEVKPKVNWLATSKH